jgi:site-specific DNA-cytosine methylase
MRPLDEFIIDKTICVPKISISLQKNLDKIKINDNYKTNYIVTPFTYSSIMNNISPTLTTRCGSYFHTTYKRYLTTRECLSLQGFPITFLQVISNRQIFKQTGNSMSVNVIKSLFQKIFEITNM